MVSNPLSNGLGYCPSPPIVHEPDRHGNQRHEEGRHVRDEQPPLADMRPHPQSHSQTPVLIIGGGPAGLLCSVLLAKCNIPSTVLERHARRLGQPKAHAVNPRSLEILRQAGIDTDALRKLGATAQEADRVRFVTSIAGLEIGSLMYERQDEDVKSLTPEPLLNIPQPLLEKELLKVAEETGMVTIWREWQWQDCAEFADGSLVSKVLDRQTNAEVMITSKYLIGCDGAHARSRVRFGIPFESLDGEPPKPIHYCSVNFKADLSGEKSGMLWFIMTKDKGKRNFIAYNRSNNWAFVTCYDPTVTSKKTFTDEYCKALIDESIGRKVDYDILSITLWNIAPMVAKKYRSPRMPNGFIAGDAAHCFPSTGGLGVNTGFGDVHNLVWKLHAVETGAASTHLFDTYEAERIPVAIANSRQSRLNEAKIHQLGQAVFGSSSQADSTAKGDDGDDDDGCGGGFGGADDVGDRATWERRLLSPASKKQIETAIRDNLDHFDSLDLQLGYVYGTPRDPRRRACAFEPSCAPGARLPHGWLGTGEDGTRMSALDCCPYGGFTLFVSEGFGDKPKGGSSVGGGLAIKVVVVGRDVRDLEGGEKWSALMGFESETTAAAVPCPDNTSPSSALHAAAAAAAHSPVGVLVRPDQHILARVGSWDAVRAVMGSYLGVPAFA
ncbi:hypothetical protein MKZ38_007184 [Zalerion maritima]|uniref:FAD-binding domain-containing protein n=1 Tax=Zalerion maritima TaxID=339359 RepID=A0AAD5RIT0_9PEZI|nr:hypothetical protein MKZ38_007184 [Zalerion maritima]